LIESMQALKKLELSLSDLKLSNETFKILGESILPSLRSLDSLSLWMSGNTMSDECVRLILKNLPNLKTLNLNLSETLITDKIVEMFIKEVFPRLGALESFSFPVSETKISKENLGKLKHISELLKKRAK